MKPRCGTALARLERACKVHVFVSFDIQHDEDLYELLLAQSRTPSSGFAVLAGSKRSSTANPEGASVRQRIRDADQVIVICGEHTEVSTRVSAELQLDAADPAGSNRADASQSRRGRGVLDRALPGAEALSELCVSNIGPD
ncbi:MAG: hypothetical protein P8Y26_16630 [Gemmatimonadales bacterium]